MAVEQSRSDHSRPRGGELNAAISVGMVRLIAEYTGRGPTKARTFINDNLVVCLLHETLTKGERSLVARDEAEAVLRTRKTYQSVMRGDASRLVEELTGRAVIGFMSDNHIDPDMAIECFVLDGPVAAEDGSPDD